MKTNDKMEWYRLYGAGKNIPMWNMIFTKYGVLHRYCRTKYGIMYIIECHPEVKDQIREELGNTITKIVKLSDDRVERFNEIIDSVEVEKQKRYSKESLD